jgi:hypothetical protein
VDGTTTTPPGVSDQTGSEQQPMALSEKVIVVGTPGQVV